jgi:hypothetical protein
MGQDQTFSDYQLHKAKQLGHLQPLTFANASLSCKTSKSAAFVMISEPCALFAA